VFLAGAATSRDETASTNETRSADMSSLLQGKSGWQQGAAVSNKATQLETTADVLDYDRKTGWATAKGHVIIRKGDEELDADYVQVNLATEDATAVGNVVMKKAGSIWKGDKLRYNFKSKKGDVMALAGGMAPFQVKAAKTERTTDNQYVLQGADAGKPADVATYVQSTSGNAFEGVVVRGVSALFPINVLSNHFASASYAVSVSVTNHYLAGLTPNARYAVAVLTNQDAVGAAATIAAAACAADLGPLILLPCAAACAWSVWWCGRGLERPLGA